MVSVRLHQIANTILYMNSIQILSLFHIILIKQVVRNAGEAGTNTTSKRGDY